MKIEIWSDVYCPFCYIGETILTQTLAQYPNSQEIEIEFKSFELDPTIPQGTSYPVVDYVAKKYQLSQEQAKANNHHIEQRAASIGLQLDFSNTLVANTLDAHRLIHFAQEQDRGLEMVNRLFKAQFQDGLNIGNHDILVQLAQELDFDPQQVRDMLTSKQYLAQVKVEAQEGVELGVRSVPFFLFDRKVAISGAQPQNIFEQAIEQSFGLTKQTSPFTTLGDEHAGQCGPDGCQL